MKVHIEIDMTPEEARKLMGLPDVSAMQERMMEEVERRMRAAVDGSDPEAMLKAWMPVQGFEQFQQFLWDAARGAATGSARKPAPKR